MLFAAQQFTFAVIVWANQSRQRRGATLLALGAGFGFLAGGLGYFQLCRTVGLAPLWLFLLGFVPSWPLAIPAAYRIARRGSLLRDFLWTWAGFSLYFAACAGYIFWRSWK